MKRKENHLIIDTRLCKAFSTNWPPKKNHTFLGIDKYNPIKYETHAINSPTHIDFHKYGSHFSTQTISNCDIMSTDVQNLSATSVCTQSTIKAKLMSTAPKQWTPQKPSSCIDILSLKPT